LNIAVIVQARVGSTRLPKKILKKIKNKMILDYVFERLKYCKRANDIILATTTNRNDDILEKYARENEIKYYRGSEEDVLKRYYDVAKKYKSDVIVRITSDCPLIDPEIVDEMIKKHIENKADYTSNIIKRTFPRGMDIEIFNFDILEETYKNANEKYHREHVTPYIREHPERFKFQNIEAKEKINRPDIRITVDTKEDFELIKKILLHFEEIDFKAGDVIDFLDENPELYEINKNVIQKGVKSS
jgi:spore coat polysaccharide biosynthesis protein SpsF